MKWRKHNKVILFIHKVFYKFFFPSFLLLAALRKKFPLWRWFVESFFFLFLWWDLARARRKMVISMVDVKKKMYALSMQSNIIYPPPGWEKQPVNILAACYSFYELVNISSYSINTYIYKIIISKCLKSKAMNCKVKYYFQKLFLLSLRSMALQKFRSLHTSKRLNRITSGDNRIESRKENSQIFKKFNRYLKQRRIANGTKTFYTH